jgi:hypothetical protein
MGIMAEIMDRIGMVVIAAMFGALFFSISAYADEGTDEKVAALLEKLKSHDMSELDEIRCAIAAYGADAFPLLMKELRQPARQMDFRGVSVVFGIMGPEVKTLIPEFIEMLKTRETTMNAIFAFASLGDDVTPQLLEALKDGDETLSKNALTVFHLMGFQAKAAAPFVEKVLQSGNEREKGRAISALSRFGEESLPILLKAANSASGDMRTRAISAIGFVLTYPQGMPIVESRF